MQLDERELDDDPNDVVPPGYWERLGEWLKTLPVIEEDPGEDPELPDNDL